MSRRPPRQVSYFFGFNERRVVEQAVLVYFPLSDAGFGSARELEVLGGLGDDLREVIAEAEVGEFDGYDVGERQYTLYLYGPNADELFDAIEPLLVKQKWPRDVVAVKRYGAPGAAEVRVPVDGRGRTRG
jgi:hypothetical protein